MSIFRVFVPLCVAALALVSPASADPLDSIHEDDREALEALSLYPEDVRGDALEVASVPGVLVRLQELQDDSQEAFRELLDPYGQSDQEQLFELSRYPDLVEKIARDGPKSRGELERIARDYPEDVRDAVLRQGGERHRVVSRMFALLDDFDRRFDDLIADLSPARQRAFRNLLGTPELLSLLTEHTQMTVLLGDAYDRDPVGVREALRDLNLEVARRNAEEADDWKRTVDADPDLRRDYDAAAADYRRDTGYDPYQPPARTVVNINVNPYPYWFGYPWWYPVSYTYYDPWYWWYPRRIWGHCGYSYGPRMVFYGGGPFWRPFYPSYHFTSWYFSFGHHHHRYPHLSDRFVSYYQRPVVINNYHYNVRKRVVRKFVYESRHSLPAGYWKSGDRKERVERFREFGRLAPQIERARGQKRFQELQKNRSRHGPGRDFTLRDWESDDRSSREEVRKIVAKNPRAYPALAKVKREDWDRPREREIERPGRGGGVPGAESDRGRRDAKPSVGQPKPGDTRQKGRAARPALEPTPEKRRPGADATGRSGRGDERSKTRAPDEARPGLERPAAGPSGSRSGAGKARPNLQRPGGAKPDASPGRSGRGGGKPDASSGRSGRSSETPDVSPGRSGRSGEKPDASPGRGGRSGDRSSATTSRSREPSSAAGSSRSRERAQPKVEPERTPERKARPSLSAPRSETPTREAPRARQQEMRSTPKAQSAPKMRRPETQSAPKARPQETRNAPRARQQETRSAPRARQPEPRTEAPRVQRESRSGGGGDGKGGRGGGGGGKGGKDGGDDAGGGGGRSGRGR